MKYGVVFAGFALYFGVIAIRLPMPWSTPLWWLMAGFALTSWAYAANRVDLLGKRGRHLRSSLAVVCLPHTVLTLAVWHLVRWFRSAEAISQLRENLFIGRRLLPSEMPPQIRSVVDLTAELPEPDWGSRTLLSVPVLDGMPPRPDQLLATCRALESLEGPVYLHCARGFGRTATFAAAVLMVREGLSLEAALEQVRTARPGAIPNRAQAEMLVAFQRGLLSDDALHRLAVPRLKT